MAIVNHLLTIIHFKGTGKTGNVSWVSFLKLFVPNLCPICGRFSTLSQFVGNFVPHGSSTFQLWVWRVKQWRPRRSLTSYSWSPLPTKLVSTSSHLISHLFWHFIFRCFVSYVYVDFMSYQLLSIYFVPEFSLAFIMALLLLSWSINAKRQNEKYNISTLFFKCSSLFDVVYFLIEHWHPKFLVLLSAETCSPLMWTTPQPLATSLKFPHPEMYIERIPCILSFSVCHPAQ